jgi:ASC-1-like (ASCH) protein
MIHHVAILQRPYLKLILQGKKTFESRLSRSRLAPFECVGVGDIIHFKQTSGPFVCRAMARRIHSFDQLTPRRIEALKHRFNKRVCGDDAYWLRKARSRFATFIELAHVTPVEQGPSFPKSHGLAWFVLPETTNTPAFDTSLTVHLSDGALRNRYLPTPEMLQPGPVTLLLADGRTLHTQVTSIRRILTRRWARDYADLSPGDMAVFVPAGSRRYRVRFVTAASCLNESSTVHSHSLT